MELRRSAGGVTIAQVCTILGACAIWLPIALFAQTAPQGSNKITTQVAVPFVGCKSDGQGGPLDAPEGTEKIVQMDASAAQRLAYYKAENSPGVLAPRGWNCFGTYGSRGSSLFVTPQPINSNDLLSSTWVGITGPGIQIIEMAGDTSGRFDVARVIARVFPAEKAFVEAVIKDGIEPAANFPFGAYPQDRLVSRSDKIVEYRTPANTIGLGTAESQLKQDEEPIEGVAILQGETPDLVLLAVRLPGDAIDLSPEIAQQSENDSSASSAAK
jgi:hypothetical protein